MNGLFRRRFLILSVLVALTVGSVWQVLASSGPVLTINHQISEEPLMGGQVVYKLTIGNQGSDPVTDKGYNLTISETLDANLTYSSATIAPSLVSTQEDGSTLLIWDNIADIEVNEEIDLFVTAVLSAGLTAADDFTNQFNVAVNTVPDNSGTWLNASDLLTARPQAIDIEMMPKQSTSDEQATGAGEYDGSADWPFQYEISVKNNNVDSTEYVTATAILPSSLAYMGSPVISPNPNMVAADPVIELLDDGSLKLDWALGTLTTAEYSTPVVITFDVAIPYRFRTSADTAAAAGAFAGPMSGDIIPEDEEVAVTYEASGTYASAGTADGVQSTPVDDNEAKVTAEYLTVSKSVTPKVVGIGTTVTYSLNYYVSEYYTTTNVVLVDVLPDGTKYVDDSASVTPVSVQTDVPGEGQTTITWEVDAASTTPGSQGQITFQATIDPVYEAAPYTGQPVVSGDQLTNKVTIGGDWQDVVTIGRFGTAIPDTSTATVNTRYVTFSKDVWDAGSSSWKDNTLGFTGDTIQFRLQYDAAADMDAKEIVIRDFLPRGMTFVNGSDNYTVSGNYSDSATCTSAPSTPTLGTLNGLQYLEWRLCNTERGSSWEATIGAMVSDIPDAQPGWIVANFGKLSGQNTYGDAYSLRDMAMTDYVAPELVLTKSAQPSTNLQPGDTVTYTITLANQGDAAAYNMVVTDTLPANLLLMNNGGSASPSSSSFTITSGDPVNGNGGSLAWSSVSSLAAGQSQTFSYQVTIPAGVVAGESMTNLASVGYNSRSDNTGHQWNTTSNTADLNTDDETVYVRGATITKTPDRSAITIGETMTWTLNVSVPAGVIVHWPVVEENNLPTGFYYVDGSSVVTNATLDSDVSHHAQNPLFDGAKDVRWFLETIDNTASSDPYEFSISFQTLVTGRKTNGSAAYKCCRRNADNDAFVGWYDTAAGYNGTGHATDSYSTTQIDRRSSEADGDVKVIQPNVTIEKSSDFINFGAGGVAVFTLQMQNTGKSPAYDLVIDDPLPAGLTYRYLESYRVIGADNGHTFTDNNSGGATELQYGLDVLEPKAILEIVFSVIVPADISADLEFQNVATVTSYRSLPTGNNDAWVYGPVSDAVQLYTPAETILKEGSVEGGEFTFGSTVIYTLTVPARPIPATMYNVVVTDVVDSRLNVVSVSNGSADGNTVTANFSSIAPNAQEQIIIEAEVPASGRMAEGDIISNRAERIYDHAISLDSNIVAYTFIAPAFVVNKSATPRVVEAGDVVTYTITVDNVGSSTATNVAVNDVMSADMQFVSNSATINGSPLADPTGGIWQLDDLSGKAQHVIVYQATVLTATEGSIISNTASVTGNDVHGEPIPADNSAAVAADTDEDDAATTNIYGPLTCSNEEMSVAFEDLKNTGWSDWDYNDVLVRITIEKCLTQLGGLGAMNVTYNLMARGAGYDHNLRHEFPLLGKGQYDLTVYEADGSVAGTDSANFENIPDVSIFGRTWEAMPPLNGCPEPFVNTRPEQTTFVPGQSVRLSIVMENPEDNLAAWMPPAPFDVYIHVYNTGEEVHLNIPGHMDNSQSVLGAFDASSPLVGYDLPLAHVFDVNFDWPLEQFGLWRAYPQYERFIKSGNAANSDWDALENADQTYIWQYAPDRTLEDLLASRDMRRAANSSSYYAAPVVADLRGTGDRVIILGNQLSNQLEVRNLDKSVLWTADLGGSIRAKVVVADITGDGNQEIIVGSSNGYVHAYRHDGTVVSGWPVQVSAFRILATPAVANLDGTGLPEIVVPAADGHLYVLNADGSAHWDATLGGVEDSFNSQSHNSSPVVADLDGNGSLEIVVGSYDKHLYAFKSNGDLLWKYETADPIIDTPTVMEINSDNSGLEIIMGVSEEISTRTGYSRSALVVLDSEGEEVTKSVAGWSSLTGSVLAADVDGNGSVELFVGNSDGAVMGWTHDGTLLAGWPKAAGSGVASQPQMGDVDADGQNEIVVTSADGKAYAWNLDGTAVTTNWPRSASVTIQGEAVVMNLDSDDMAEVVVADMGGELYVWEYETPEYKVFLPIVNK